MLQKYAHFMYDLLKFGEDVPTWDQFCNELLSAEGKTELKALIMSVCGPYSIPEYAIENPDVIPVLLYQDNDKTFRVQFEASTTPIAMYDLDTWLDSILAFWHDTPESTDVELEKLAKGFICHAVNSYFTGNTEPYVVERQCGV